MEELSLNKYQQLAARTMIDKNLTEPNLAVAGLGLTGEAGEVADIIKKVIGHRHPLHQEKLLEELGDVLWYCAMLASLLNVSLESVAKNNIDKLLKRYPDGFDPLRSLNRPVTNS